MKNQLTIMAAIAGLLTYPALSRGQGSLVPDGPPAPIMKTLEQVEPRTPISMVPFTIKGPGSYYLTDNLSGGTLTIATNDVTVDLNGFTLGLGGLEGIKCLSGIRGIVIRNGMVRGTSQDGIDTVGADQVVIKNILVADCGSAGIRAGDNTHISGCVVLSNGDVGIRVGTRCTVFDCVANSNTTSGIFIGGRHSRVTDCQSSYNGQHGIDMSSGDALIARNICHENGQQTASGAGIRLVGARNRVEDNHVSGNDNGIQNTVPGTNQIVIRNTALENGSNYVNGGSWLAGPFVSGTGTISNNNPWANFDN